MTGSEAQALVEAGIERLIGDPAQWQQWARTQAQFHRYSPQNVVLILIQRPDATRVAGFQTWKALGRFVRRGEHGITILAPLVRKMPDPAVSAESASDDPPRRLVGFRPVTVFDIAQTDGAPLADLPQAQVLTGADWAPVLQALITAAVPVPVVTAPLPSDVWGMWRPDVGTITLAPQADPNMQLKTLLHEWAHSVGIPAGTPVALDKSARAEEEVIAETTAYIVGHLIGLDTLSYSQSYVAGWSDRSPETVRRALQAIQHRVHTIMETIAHAPDSTVQALAQTWTGTAMETQKVS